MSYCRFSSDDFQSNVYVYEHVHGGYFTHVASRKLISDIPKLSPPSDKSLDNFVESYRAQSAAIKVAEFAPIGLPYDDENFVDDTLPELLNRLTMLKEVGYHIPQEAFDRIKAEIEENKVNASTSSLTKSN